MTSEMYSTKKILSGLDVLKFLMALVVVDIHVKGTLAAPPHFTGLSH